MYDGTLTDGNANEGAVYSEIPLYLANAYFFNFLCSNFLTLIPLSHESICVYTRTKEYTICEYTRVLEFYDNLYLPVSVKTGSNQKEEMLTNLTKLIIDTEN